MALTTNIARSLFLSIYLSDLFGSAMVCFGYRDTMAAQNGPPRYWLETLLVVTVLQFGGTTLTGLVLGQTPSWLSSHTAGGSLALMWWATFFCPRDAWHRLMSVNAFRACVLLGAWFSTAHAVTSWGLDKALGADHQRAQASLLVALLTGTLSGCGGGLIANSFNLTESTWRFQKAAVFSGPLFSIEKSFICAVCYYTLRNPHGFLWMAPQWSPADSRAATSVLMVELSLAKFTFPHWRITEVRASPCTTVDYCLTRARFCNLQALGDGLSFALRIQPYVDVSSKREKAKAS